jgi:ankyrin repeat protein
MGLRMVPSAAGPAKPFGKGGEWPRDDQALFLAAGGGSIEELVSLIRAGANVDYRDPGSGMTPLMTVRTRIQAAVLLAAGADPNLRDREGQTALHHGLFADEAEAIVRLLLAAGADVEVVAKGDGNGTPLLVARSLFYEGRDPLLAERVVQLLLEAGADPDARDGEGYTMLMTAVVKRRAGLVGSLLSLGADPNLRTDAGVSALDMAVREGADDLGALLIRAGGRE